jgi:asparagine synthase (glutamine-hydrolysing)
MCGIAGIYYRDKDRQGKANVPAVLSALRNRGSGGEGHTHAGRAELFHSRLIIVDPTAASAQPFTDEEKKEFLVFNGEIFNFRELRSGMKDLRTNGDTEILFRSLKKDNENALQRLSGFFAFAFYDSRAESLFLARDRYGVKPLYYYSDDRNFAFASNLLPLIALTGMQEVDPEQRYAYFRLNYTAGRKSILKNIGKLLPGECLKVKGDKTEIQQWYQAAPERQERASLYSLMDDAVKARLHADVPLGAFLSGGLDSSIIAALAIKHKPDLNTYTIGFRDAEYFDESPFAQIVAKHIGSRHQSFLLSEDDFLSELDRFFDAMDEPFADSSAFNFYMLCLHAGREIKVALSGDGADELFKGYRKHVAFELSNKTWLISLAAIGAFFTPGSAGSRESFMANRIRQFHKFRKLSGLTDWKKIEALSCISSAEELEKLLSGPSQNRYFNDLFRDSDRYSGIPSEDAFDLSVVLEGDMLVKTDRFSMFHSLEVRNPFLDKRIVEYALALDRREKIRGPRTKLVLRREFSKLLPQSILSRSKKGFELPLRRWLCGQLRTRLEKDWLNEEQLRDEGLIDLLYARNLLQRLFSTSPGDSAAQVWAIVVWREWEKRYLKE